jgi:hypothetical protein
VTLDDIQKLDWSKGDGLLLRSCNTPLPVTC